MPYRHETHARQSHENLAKQTRDYAVSHAVRRRETGDDAPPDLRRMIRVWDVDYRLNVQNELRKRRYHVGPAEFGRLKRRLALKRLRKRQASQRAAVKASLT